MTRNPLENLSKTCPQCKEEMSALYDKKAKLAYWECLNCGNLISATQGVYLLETTKHKKHEKALNLFSFFTEDAKT